MPVVPSGPGYYQGQLKGRASGRVSPREAIRGPVRERVYAAHGLMDQGAADVNQGQLFSPSELPPKRSEKQIAFDAGVPAPLPGNAPGFMPAIQRSTRTATVKAKVNALNTLQSARVRTGADRGTGAPVAEAMQDRSALYAQGKPADWYQPVSEGRNVLGEGMARTAIDNAALRTGSTNAEMTRATALTSPRTAWDEGGAPGTTDYTMPNLESAENVVRAVKALPDTADREDVTEAGRGAPGNSLAGMKAKAADYHFNEKTTSPIRVSDPSSQKVPNFEQSLHMSHIDPAVVKGAAGSYTVDRWDVEGIGGDEKMLKSDMGYAVAHMTGVRSALKAGELPPNFQARTWNTMRDKAQPATMGTNRLFVSKRSGGLAPNPNAIAPERAMPVTKFETRSQRRSGSMADKYDLEF